MSEQKTEIPALTKNYNLSSLGPDGVSALVNMGQGGPGELGPLDEKPVAYLDGTLGNVQKLSPDMLLEMPGRYNQSEVINTSEQVRNPNILKRIGGAAARVLHIVKPS